MLYFFAAIEQPYSAADIIMNDAHVMLDNSVTLACSVPAHLSDHVTVVAWRVEESGLIDPIELNKNPASYGSVHNLHGTRSQMSSRVLVHSAVVAGPQILCGTRSVHFASRLFQIVLSWVSNPHLPDRLVYVDSCLWLS